MIIKILLVSCFVLVIFYLVGIQNSAKIRAWRKIAMFVLAAFAIFTVLDPNSTTEIAELVGVGRGADLLLYLISVAVFFLGLHSYIKFRQLEQTIVKLARKVALLEASKAQEKQK